MENSSFLSSKAGSHGQLGDIAFLPETPKEIPYLQTFTPVENLPNVGHGVSFHFQPTSKLYD